MHYATVTFWVENEDQNVAYEYIERIMSAVQEKEQAIYEECSISEDSGDIELSKS